MTIKTKLALVYAALIIILLFAAITAKATTYYFSSVSGDDNRTPAQASNSATPWRTLDKLKSFWESSSAVAGDRFLLKSGETFYGDLEVKKSGTPSAQFFVGSYSTGAPPVITGFTTIIFPTNSGGGIYESQQYSQLLSSLDMVLVNGVQYGRGRYPDANTSNGGYMVYESKTGTDHSMGDKTMRDNQLPASPSWAGADVVIKHQKYIIDRYRITNHASNGTLTYRADRAYNSGQGNGYFFTNHERTLTQFGEWYHNPSTDKIKMYFGGSPSSYTVEAATISTLLYSSGKSFWQIDNINFRGANGTLADISDGSNFKITNSDLRFAGYNCMTIDDASLFLIDNCTITDGNNDGILTKSCVKHTITNSTVRNIFMFPGMGANGDGHGTSIRNTGDGIVEYNRIINSGYIAIHLGQGGAMVRNNYIDSFCLIKDDGGGIYTYTSTYKPSTVLRTIRNNIVINGIGTVAGIYTVNNLTSVYNIYMDDNTNNVLMEGNFLMNGNYGMYLHNAPNNQVRNNTFFNHRVGSFVAIDNPGNQSEIFSLVFDGNYYVQAASTEIGMSLHDNGTSPQGFGTFNNQVYARPTNSIGAVKSQVGYPTGTSSSRTLAGWKTYSGKDAGSVESWTNLGASGIIYFLNDTKNNKTFNFSGTYKTPINVSHTSSISLAPFTWVVLIKTSGGAPSPNVAPTVNITSPASGTNYNSPATIVINATATDPDGTVSSVKFYNGTTLLNTDNASPYTYTWSSVANGNYSITAIATDDDLDTRTSSAVTVNVTTSANTPPTVSISAPANNATYTAPASITINATAADAGGSVSSVAFYNGAELLGTDNSSPYSYNWTSVPTGSYSITAIATDNASATTTSSVVSVTVEAAGNQDPTVSITSPTGGATYTSPATVIITSTVNDPDGSILKVDFYEGTTFLHSESDLPYTWDWENVLPGTYSITAKAYDDDNSVVTSGAVAITVNEAVSAPTVSIVSPANASNFGWPATINFDVLASSPNGEIDKVEFYHSGTTLFQTENTAPWTFSRGGWSIGTTVVTAKAYDFDGNSTTSSSITFTVTGNNIAPTVSLTSPSETQSYTNPASIILSATASDADGSIANVKFYNGATLLNTDATFPYSFTWSGVGIGTYAITARATDDDGSVTITDAVNITVYNEPPIDSIISPITNAFFYTPADIVITAGAEDVNGTISKVDFYEGTTFLGTDANAPYTYTWNGVTSGSYDLSVVATDNDGATSNSGHVIITVGTHAPATLAITSTLDVLYNGAAQPVTVVTDPVGLTGVSVTYGGSGTAPTNTGIYPLVISLTHSSYVAENITDTLVISKVTPVITWPTPGAITYPTAISGTQLNATASVPGIFTYTPISGTIPNAGTQILTVTFVPTDQTNYNSVVGTSVNLVVNKATATISLTNLNQVFDGQPKPVSYSTTPAGLGVVTITYNGSPTAPSAIASYSLSAILNNTNYQTTTPATGTLVISATGANISISNLSQTYDGSPKPVTVVCDCESYSVTYNGSAIVPENTGTYEVIATITGGGSGSDTETLVIIKGNPVITWPQPSAITYLTALSGTQLNASASVAGTFTYVPISGTVLNAGTQTLSATFVPTDAANWNTINAITNTLVVNKAVTVLSFDATTLLQLWDGTAKSVIVISTPEVLSGLTVTYNSSTTVPRSAGEYSLVVTLNNANYQATSITGTFSIVPIGVPGETYNFIILNRTTIINQ